MIPIVWKEYRCTMSGFAIKFVLCEKCGTVYVYQMTRQVEDAAASVYFLDNKGAEERARLGAEASLQNTLEADCDGVPCLNCGTYQKQMVQKIKEERYKWLPWAAVLLPILAFIYGVFTWYGYQDPNPSDPEKMRNRLIFAVVLGGLAILAVISQFIVSRYDPNSAPLEERRSLGRERAVTLAEYEQILREQQSSES
jgi:hypothetical protein